MLVKIIILIVSISFSYLVAQISYGQSEEKTFTSPKFGLSMKYPADWTFLQEEQDFTPEGSASLGDFCPTSAVGSNPKVLDCHMNLELHVPVYLSITAFKLNEGTTLKKFYDQEVAEMKPSNDIVGRKNLETNDIKISGLSAIQTIGTIGGGDLDKLLEGIGHSNPKSKYMVWYVVNGGIGYKIWARRYSMKSVIVICPSYCCISFYSDRGRQYQLYAD